ncbi:MAG TPA: NAD-dependent epimerase/dehydratase family protein [Candidatus Sumerlaeota bacterium]|nr:NAD-dependent epimerase/dehydratase family protein [Candidatus Sumerlaeota bacterium]HOR29460.1 NAD-dependent epimerase/dehydratase family protein [Candidatus Sumerlaeota bacterium]HPK03892.1 NAD-dependent epimerase/dehydratase family protein [Candidatus Sumerlaeota bacterium]
MRKVLVTGSCGLIGSEAVLHYDRLGRDVHGIDNNMRRDFFGDKGDTTWVRRQLSEQAPRYRHHEIDIRDRGALEELFRGETFDLICHCAAQPSHDLSARRPMDDFDVNAVGTLNLLELTRRHCPEAVFICMSTNKVYGDGPNRLRLVEGDTRYDFADAKYQLGISEKFPIDRCLHTPFGASKVAADVMAQEYGHYFGIRTVVFRGGCLTGPRHSGVELHGFLNYLVKATLEGIPYTVHGYKGKQVRDQIHSADVIAAFDAYAADPKPGAIYNLGGGRENSLSVLEAIQKVEAACRKKLNWTYSPRNRVGDHICYYSDLTRMRRELKGWDVRRSIDTIIAEIVKAQWDRLKRG